MSRKLGRNLLVSCGILLLLLLCSCSGLEQRKGSGREIVWQWTRIGENCRLEIGLIKYPSIWSGMTECTRNEFLAVSRRFDWDDLLIGERAIELRNKWNARVKLEAEDYDYISLLYTFTTMEVTVRVDDDDDLWRQWKDWILTKLDYDCAWKNGREFHCVREPEYRRRNPQDDMAETFDF